MAKMVNYVHSLCWKLPQTIWKDDRLKPAKPENYLIRVGVLIPNQPQNGFDYYAFISLIYEDFKKSDWSFVKTKH